jgi:hypothetical protein
VGSFLESLDADAIAGLLANAARKGSSFGGKALELHVGNQTVFCKLVPLTALELTAANHMSTANLFQLPAYYQYGIGSIGFGAWRELAAHILTTRWVLEGLHAQFPLLYHWRIMQGSSAAPANAQPYEYLAHAAAHGKDESRIRQRLDAVSASQACIALFTEHFAHTLSQWLLAQLQTGPQPANAAVRFVEAQSRDAFDFMRAQRFIHFDAHLQNILTDGTRLYFADFGLATHASFNLDAGEKNFLAHHTRYDAARFAASLVHTLCAAIAGQASWREKLTALNLHTQALAPAGMASLQQHAPTALYMAQLAHTLIHKDRHALFSAAAAAQGEQ